jgi:hypothetical protein
VIRRSALTGDTVAVLQRAALQDPHLSYRAVGILVAVLSRPLDWRTSAEQLARERPGAEGRDAIRTALRELETAGYLVRTRSRDDLGRIRTGWDLSDTPLREASQGENSQDEIPLGGNSPGRNSSSGSTRGRNSQEETPQDGSTWGGNSQEASQEASQGEPCISAGHTDDGKPAVGQPAVGQPGLLQGVETGGRDKNLSFPPAVVSPGPDLGEGGRKDRPEEEAALRAVVEGVGRPDLSPALLASSPLRVAVTALVRAGVTSRALRGSCEAHRWAGAGVGAVVRYVQGLRAGDLVVRAPVGPPECPEHPGQPAGRCRECERASVPVALVAGLVEGLRAAVRTSHTVNV